MWEVHQTEHPMHVPAESCVPGRFGVEDEDVTCGSFGYEQQCRGRDAAAGAATAAAAAADVVFVVVLVF